VESFPKISEAVATAVSAALLGKMTPQAALDAAAQQVDTELAGG
jgi:maltose-binding protein MalE